MYPSSDPAVFNQHTQFLMLPQCWLGRGGSTGGVSNMPFIRCFCCLCHKAMVTAMAAAAGEQRRAIISASHNNKSTRHTAPFAFGRVAREQLTLTPCLLTTCDAGPLIEKLLRPCTCSQALSLQISYVSGLSKQSDRSHINHTTDPATTVSGSTDRSSAVFAGGCQLDAE